MPGGLPGVSQEFTADASGYVAAIRVMIEQNRDLIRSIADVNAAIGSLKDKEIRITADTSGAMRSIAEVKAALDGIGDKEVTVAVKYAGGDGPGGNWGMFGPGGAAQVRDYNRAMDDYGAAMDEAAAANKDFNASQVETVRLGAEGRDALNDLMAAHGMLRETMTAGQAAIAKSFIQQLDPLDQMVVKLGVAKEAYAGLGDASKPLAYTADSAQLLNQVLDNTKVSADGATRALDGHAAAAALSAAAAGRIIGGGGGGGGGFGPFGLSGSAGSQADSVIAFAKTWLPRLHWAMMATNEVLATVGPAAVAVGAAALVGLEGGQQLVNRYNAIDATAESIGPAFGQTTGSFMGAGSALQRYQTMADGGVYELAGAGINIARTGGGTYGQMGLNTIAMVDRGVADMQVNMQQRGTNAQLASILGGGTDYLKTFGDIGANVGNIFLGLAPHLPGLGGDYLGALSGATGGAASLIQLLNRNHLGDVLGGGLALEAGGRVGTPLVGLVGKLLQSGGLKLAGLGGDSLLGEAGLGIGSLGEGLTALGGPEVAGLALSAFLGSKLYSSMPGSAERQMGALQQSVYGNGGYSSAFTPLARAITTATGLGISASQQKTSIEGIGATETYGELGRFGPMGQTTAGIYQQAASGFSRTMGNLIDSGPQLQQALQKAGLKGVSMADAFQIAQNSLLDLSHAFDGHGQLTKQAKQMMTNYVSAIGPMTQNAGAFGAAVAGQTIMGTEAMQDVAKVNQAMDSMTQIMTAGPTGMSSLATMAGGPSIAKALTSFTSPSSANAWATFASSSSTNPGIVTQLQQFNDQMRTGLTLGALGPGQAAGLTGYELKQFLPQAKQSPAALAMLMQQGAQQGITGYYDPNKSQAQNYAAAVAATNKIADNARQANQAMTSMTVKLSNLPEVAKQFTQGTAADIQSQQIAKAAQDAMNIKGGINVKANVSDLINQLKAAGVQGGSALKQSLDAVLAQAGVSKAARIKIEADNSAALAAINAIHGKTVSIYANAQGVAAAQGAIDSIHGKTVSVYVNEIISGTTVSQGALQSAGFTPGVTTSQLASVMRKGSPGFSTGGMVPGFGSGDHVPALLEPGEAIVPRYLVPLIAPILKSHHVPGFAAGGIVPAGSLAGVNSQLSGEWKTLDQMYAAHAPKSQIDAFWKDFLDPLYAAKDAFGSVSKSAASTAASTKAATTAANTLATSIANKFTTAMNFARGVSGAASAGQGFGTTGLLSGVDTTQTSVGQYMTDYLTSETGFTSDLKTLTKGGLNKSLIQQLVAAGPVQGDLLAQSILQQGGTTGAAGGISSINKLWSQIGAQSHALGSQAAMSVYGQSIAPNLKSGTVTSNNISINVNVPSGSGANLALTTAQIKLIVEAVQAALLKQAKRNRTTGVALAGKKA